ncbi:hypothetical protein Q4Q35_14460 [Flavivirga aquimarina]|uniref:Uncharacterized protein n=1 Tax=Flavivirga aquimarina TaxID=2027862 RepID=A0ABT8WDB1_9FLAO|nr:hypothetical protein [Flavivirga aquimarina]MDO5971007.1 hypothetical protein [Flavivirga aquimarina]
MKKLSYIILGFIIGAVLTYYFCPKSIDTETMETKVKTAEELVRPDGAIEQDYAQKLNKNWTEYREPAVDSAAQRQGREKDNRWTEWSLEELEEYLVYSQGMADLLGYKMNGVRVYLGVYGEDSGPKKKNLTTMFIVPRGKKKQEAASMIPFSFQNRNKNLPIDPLNDGNGGSGGYE